MDVNKLRKDGQDGKLGVDQLVDVIDSQQQIIQQLQSQNGELQKLVEQLQRRCGQPTKSTDQYSLEANAKREQAKQKRRKKQKSLRRGRRTTKDKLVGIDREQNVFPEGFSEDSCQFQRTQWVWRIENGHAVLVAYHLHHGPNGESAGVGGSIGRSEYGIEIVVAVSYLTFVIGLSIDRVCELLRFFWKLELPKSQADALINRLAREWEPVFEGSCPFCKTVVA